MLFRSTLPLNTTADANKRALFQEMGNIRPQSGTPLRRKLQDVGDYYRGTSNSSLFGSTYNHTGTFTSRSPILNAANGGECQQNFTILMTDGFWNGGNPSPRVYNADALNATRTTLIESDLYKDRANNVRDTLADVAMFYYDTDLAPSLADQVEIKTGLDINPRQHMVTYTVAFGIKGEIGQTFAGLDPTVGTFPYWPNPLNNTSDGNVTRDKRRVDDVWHAAFNSRGKFLNASNPQSLINSIQTAINDIGARTGSAAGVSVTSGTVSSATRIYQTRFESNSWAGHLLAYQFDPATNAIVPANDFGGGTVNDAYKIIENQGGPASRTVLGGAGRTIFSYNGTTGIPFKWPSTPSSPTASEMSPAQVTNIVNGAVTGGGLPDYTLASRSEEHTSELQSH